MRILYRLMLIIVLTLAGLTATVTPATAGQPARDCVDSHGTWYPHGWAGYVDGRWTSCDNGVWHMM